MTNKSIKLIIVCAIFIFGIVTIAIAQSIPYQISSSISYQNKEKDLPDSPVNYAAANSLKESKSGREKLVRQAFEKALSRASMCDNGTLTAVFLNLDRRRTIGGKTTTITKSPGHWQVIPNTNNPISFENGKLVVTAKEGLKDGWRYFYLEDFVTKRGSKKKLVSFYVQIEYAGVQRKSNVYSETILNERKRIFPLEGHFDMCSSSYFENPDPYHSPTGGGCLRFVNEGEEHQLINAKIIIYPLAFNSDYYYMPTEKNVSYKGGTYGVWSKSIEHTLLFIVLHEIGHIDYYISQKSIIDFDKISFSDEEKDCDHYASSILKCVY
jgi:hypothetical protein